MFVSGVTEYSNAVSSSYKNVRTVDSVEKMTHFVDGCFGSPFNKIILMHAGNVIMIKLYNFTVFS